MLFVMQPGAEDEVVDPVAAAAAAAAVTEAEAQSAAVAEEAAAGEAAATTTKVKITSRDPFAPLVPKPEPVPAPKAKPAAETAPVAPDVAAASGGTISALVISPAGDSVKLKLDGKKYNVDEGESFAKSYRLYDIFNDNCAGFLYGDQNAVVCEGDSVTIG